MAATAAPNVPAPIVLVPGAWLGGWAWEEVATRLRDAGHAVHQVTLPGLGASPSTSGEGTDLTAHIDAVVAAIAEPDLREVVLVGHSYASIVVTGVADRIADRLAHLVYLDAPPSRSGRSFLEAFPPDLAAHHEAQVVRRADGRWLPFPGVDALAEGTSVEGLGPRERQLMAERAVAHPFASWTEPLETNVAGGPTPYRRTLVLCTGGGMTVADLRAAIASGADELAPLADREWRFEELPTGHWPMLSEPAATAALIGRLAAAPSVREDDQ